jgi:hypothetical protein
MSDTSTDDMLVRNSLSIVKEHKRNKIVFIPFNNQTNQAISWITYT